MRAPCVQYSTVQYSTVQYSTVQYSTVQYSTVQYLQDVALQQAVAEGVTRVELQLLLLGEQTPPASWLYLGDGGIRARMDRFKDIKMSD